MQPEQTPQRPFRRRLAEWLALSFAFLAAFLIGAAVSPWKGIPRPIEMLVQSLQRPTAGAAMPERPATPTVPETPKGFPQVDTPQPEDPRRPEPPAIEARVAVIGREVAELKDECHRAAGGDWDKWQRDTATYRDALAALTGARRTDSANATARQNVEALEGRNGFPLFEIRPGDGLDYLCDPSRLDRFRKEQSVMAAGRWLRKQDIDLIVVLVPKMTEVYIERFLDPCPPDGVIAPGVRRTIFELLNADVEVVDGWRLLRTLHDADDEYLFNPDDSRLSARGARVLSREIADRIVRYHFGARARYALPIVRAAPAQPAGNDGLAISPLTPDQRQRARRARSTSAVEVCMQDGSAVPDEATSPVVVLGSQQVPVLREQLITDLNLVTHTLASGGPATEPFADFVRDPELLRHARVLVWIVGERELADLPSMPPSILKSLAPVQ
jgi:hypothetical protein